MTADLEDPAGPLPPSAIAAEEDDRLRYLFDRRPRPAPAGTAWRVAAAVAFAAYAGLNLVVALGNHASPPELIGRVLGSLVLPLIAVGIASIWDSNRTEKTRVKVFCFASLFCAAITALSIGASRGYGQVLLGRGKSAQTAEDFLERAAGCMRSRDLACAEDSWAEYVRLRPLDGRGIANLGMVMNMRDEHAQAAEQFQKAVDAGEGTYDLFAYYADSLAKLGRVDEAIDWYYRALSVVPTLVDVRGSLAALLVNRQRPHEALALLQAFDADAEAQGHAPYFAGQRIAIEKAIRDAGGATAPAAPPLRLPVYAGHYFAPVALGDARPLAFMVDTGASRTTMSRAVLEASKASYRVVDTNIQMTTADGRKVGAELVVLDALRLGPFELKNVQAVICDGCVPLLGQSTLSRFDLQSSRAQGVEFLTLARRSGI